ncbi:superoxide dismutase family protein [Actinoplanes philippinensis]|uniref:superoxide dismutase family protein n=1 Tax=Actinoplanes philippinensis TaxID=35752 RepID=UPI0033C459C9
MNTLVLAMVAPLLLTPAPVSEGTFKTWRDGARAVTYDTAVVVSGARATVKIFQNHQGVRVNLLATGLTPGRSYGAHLHTSACGQDPAAAGPHYQHRPDPAAGPGRPSTDPAYANPRNEIWLDFTADRNGVGRAVSAQDWVFADDRQPRSLVLHAEHTHTAAGVAGTAGARLACLTLA